MKKFVIPAGVLLLPGIALAATLEDVLNKFGDLINIAGPIVVGLALLYFFWGLANYIFSSDDPEKKESGRNIMIWGVIALFVMVSVWGLVNVISSTFNLDTSTPTIPSVRGLGGSRSPSGGAGFGNTTDVPYLFR